MKLELFWVPTGPSPEPFNSGSQREPSPEPFKPSVRPYVRPDIGETHLTNGASGGLGFEALASRARRGQLNEPVGG